MPSGLPDDLADLPADIQNYMWAKKKQLCNIITQNDICIKNITNTTTLASPSSFHHCDIVRLIGEFVNIIFFSHFRRKLAELNIYLTEDEIENYKEAGTRERARQLENQRGEA